MSGDTRSKLFAHPLFKVAMAVLSILCAAPATCSGGGGGGSGSSGSSSSSSSSSGSSSSSTTGAGGTSGTGAGSGAGGSGSGSVASSTFGAGETTATYTVPDQTAAVTASATDIDNMLAQASHEAHEDSVEAWIAIVDRMGNVLSVAQTANGLKPPPSTLIVSSGVADPVGGTCPVGSGSGTGGSGPGIEGKCSPNFQIPSQYAAIAKAITAAYLSSGGNAFSTRTLNQLAQEESNPGELNNGVPSGAFFGLQFSQLPCSDIDTIALGVPAVTTGGAAGAGSLAGFPADVVALYNNNFGSIAGSSTGPQRSPLGMALDSGGLPLYKNGVLIGAIGVVTGYHVTNTGETATVGGTITGGNVLSLTLTSAAIAGSPVTVSYTVTGSDTTATAATGLAAAANANAAVSGAGVTASATRNVISLTGPKTTLAGATNASATETIAISGTVVQSNLYSLNTNVDAGVNNDLDELIAMAGAVSFEAPAAIQAQNFTVNGKTLQYEDAIESNLNQPVQTTGSWFLAVSVSPGPTGSGTVPAVPGYYKGIASTQTCLLGDGITTVPCSAAQALSGTPGQQYGTAASGIMPDGSSLQSEFFPLDPLAFPGLPAANAFVYYNNAASAFLYEPTDGQAPVFGAGTLPKFITGNEARGLVISTLTVAESTRALLRAPTNTFARVNVAIVDLAGRVLAMAQTPDTPNFAVDDAVQKARTAAFFSRDDASSAFNIVSGLNVDNSPPADTPADGYKWYVGSGVLDQPSLLHAAALFNTAGPINSGVSFTTRALGNLARPFFPDNGTEITTPPPNPGPLSLPFVEPTASGGCPGSSAPLTTVDCRWSVFSTGLQTELVRAGIEAAVVEFNKVESNGQNYVPLAGCEQLTGPDAALQPYTFLLNGMQIYGGGIPLYRSDGTLVGAIAVSGETPETDDFIAYNGILGGPTTLLSADMLSGAGTVTRADQVAGLPAGAVNYLVCPATNPFLSSRAAPTCP